MGFEDKVKGIDAACVEGRLENVLERQKLLVAFHGTLQKSGKVICDALQKECKCTEELASMELITSLDTVNALYKSLNFGQTMDQETRMKQGAGHAKLSVSAGISLILQSTYSPLFSTIGPLAASLASGSPAIVLASNGLPLLNREMEIVIAGSLDREAFVFESSQSDSILTTCAKCRVGTVVVSDLQTDTRIQRLKDGFLPSMRVLRPNYGVCAAFVDRSAEPHLSTALESFRTVLRHSSASNPLRCPQMVFVDEHILPEFKEKLLCLVGAKLSAAPPISINVDLRAWLQGLWRDRAPDQISGSECGDMSHIENIQVLSIPVDGTSSLALIPTRSLDHGIDLLNKINRWTSSQVTYIFASPKEAFYLGTFINASHVLANEIAARSLVIQAPRVSRHNFDLPYHPDDFSVSKYMKQAPQSYSSTVSLSPAKVDSRRINQHSGGRLSYFEQGLVLGLLLSTAAVSTFAYVVQGAFRLRWST